MRHAWSLRATLTKRVWVVKDGGEGRDLVTRTVGGWTGALDMGHGTFDI